MTSTWETPRKYQISHISDIFHTSITSSFHTVDGPAKSCITGWLKAYKIYINHGYHGIFTTVFHMSNHLVIRISLGNHHGNPRCWSYSNGWTRHAPKRAPRAPGASWCPSSEKVDLATWSWGVNGWNMVERWDGT